MIIIVAININGRAIFPIATIALTVDTSSVVCMIPKTLIFNGTLIMSVFTSSKLASALIIAFLIRRNFMHIKRFTGKEMRHRDHKDATFALLLILFLMISLIGMNASYIVHAGSQVKGVFPLSSLITNWIPENSAHSIELIMWWTHILLIFFFPHLFDILYT